MTIFCNYLLPVQSAAPVLLYLNKKHLEKGTGNTAVAMGKKGGPYLVSLPLQNLQITTTTEKKKKVSSEEGEGKRERGAIYEG